MESLAIVADAPGYVAGFRCYSVNFKLRASSPEALRGMLPQLPHGTVPETYPPVEADEFTLPAHTSDGQTPHEQLRTALMVHVANMSPHHVFLHAGVVSWKGKGLVLPGSSFAGKTTLVAALVRAGCLYYSDEYAVIRPSGMVEPYDRRLQMRQPGYAAQTAADVQSLGGQSGKEPLTVSLVAFAQYESAAIWSPEPVSPGMALFEMLRHSIPIRRTPARVLSTLSAMISGATSLRSSRGESALTAEILIRHLDSL